MERRTLLTPSPLCTAIGSMDIDLERARKEREAFRVIVILLLTILVVGSIVWGGKS